MNMLYLSRPVLACFDNEQPPLPPPPASEPGPEKRLTQSEVNRIMAEEKRKLPGTASAGRKDARGDVGVKEPDRPRARADAAQDWRHCEGDLRTKEEQAAHEKRQLEESYKKQLVEKTKDAETWQKRYETTRIDSALQDAAVRGDAFSTQQVVNLLRPSTRLTEVRDDKGRFTGEHQVVVDFPDTAENGDRHHARTESGRRREGDAGKAERLRQLVQVGRRQRHRQRQRTRHPDRRQD